MRANIEETKDKMFLDYTEMKKLLDITKEVPAEHLLIRLLANGLAPRDIVRIQVRHFRFGKSLLKFRGKDGVKRIIDVDLPTIALVQKFVMDEKMEKEDYLFGWREKYLCEIVQKNGELAGIKGVTPTLLRDTWVFLAVRNGRDLAYIHRQLGFVHEKNTAEIVEVYRNLEKDYQPKVLVFMPVSESKKPVIEHTLTAIRALDYHNFTVMLGVNNSSAEFVGFLKELGKKYQARVVDFGTIDAMEEVEVEGKTFLAEFESGKVISYARKARNKGLQLFREGDARFVVMCDADCPPKPDAIKSCVKYFDDRRFKKVGIVGGIVFVRASLKTKDGKQMCVPAIYFDNKRKNTSECYNFFFEHWQDVEIIEVDGLGMGWTMISREVAEKFNFDLPKDLSRFMGEDFYYCYQAKEQGYSVLCVGQIIADHLEDEEQLVEYQGTHTKEQEEKNPEEEPKPAEVEVISEFTSKFYDEEYFEDGLKGRKSGYVGYYNHPLFKNIAKELTYYFKPVKALDVGAAKGFLVSEMVKLGVDAQGIDLSDYAVQNAPEEIKGRMKVGSATQLPYKDLEFDLVVTFDMMEHLNEEQYRATIREIARVSSKNILFSITTDNNVRDKSHISVMSIQKWVEIIDKEIGEQFYRHKSNFLDQSILWFNPKMCLIYSRKRK